MIEFRNSQKIALPLTASLIVSILSVLFLATVFFFGLLLPDSTPMMPGILGGISVIPVFGFSYVVYLLRSPVRVALSDEGLSIEWMIRRKTIHWTQISRLDLKKSGAYRNWAANSGGKGNAVSELLVLLDVNEKKLAELPDTFEHFAALMQEIRQRSSVVQGRSTFDIDEHLQKAALGQRKSRVFMLVLGIVFAALGLTMTIVSIVSILNQRLLETQGQAIDALIVKHHLYNVTPRIEYSFSTPDGQAYSKDVMVKKAYWETLAEGGKVPVKYVPAKPKLNQLLYDDADNDQLPPGLTVIASLFMLVMGCGGIVMYCLNITDLKFVDGRFKIVRVGDIESNALLETLAPQEADHVTAANYIAPPIPMQPLAAAPPLPVTGPAQLPSLPKGLKVIGILNIVFGGFGLLWAAGRIVLALFFMNNPDTMPANTAVPDDLSPVMIEHSLSGVLSLLLAISGFGILLLKRWGRILAVVIAALKLLIALKDIVLVFTNIIPSTEGFAPEQRFIVNATLVFSVFLILLTMIYPAIMLIILQRKSTRQVFSKEGRQTL